MQIKSIEVHGLWSYREPVTIDLTGLPLVVGVGDNGAGKSMLLIEAPLVAFYGRFPSKTVAESITTGATSGKVTVVFGIGDATYRVSRTYPRKGSGTGQVHVADDTAKSGWRAISDPGHRATDAAILNLLGMNYETATMTWAAEQGKYGRFASAQPIERFKLLATVFDLDKYGPMAAAAKRRFDEATATVTRIDGRIAELTETLDGPVSEEGDEPEDQDGQDELVRLRKLSDDDLHWKAQSLDKEIDRVTVSIADLASSDPTRKAHEARQARDLVRNDRQSKHAAADGQRQRAEMALEQARTRGASARAAADQQFQAAVDGGRQRAIATKSQAAQIRQDVANALARIEAAERDLPTLSANVEVYRQAAAEGRENADRLHDVATAHTATYSAHKASYEGMKAEVMEARERIDILRRTSESGDHATCFSCQQHLTAGDAQKLIEAQEAAIVVLQNRMDEARTAAVAAKEQAAEYDGYRQQQLAAVQQNDDAASQQARAVSDAEALIASRAERETSDARAVEMMTEAGREEAAVLATATQTHTDAMAAAASAEAAAVREAQAELDAAAPVVAATAQPSDEETALEHAVTAAEALAASELAQVDSARQELNEERAGLREEASRYAAEAARRSEAVSQRAALEERLTDIRRDRGVAVVDRDLHDQLRAAYSPAGIPAMVLAGIMESLNEAVNASLERLSKGQLTVSIRTTRETAKGAAQNQVTVYVETPEAGLLPYESLSGGQKFRVDVAIRIGLAEVIARGTGTPIETFLLDEGWGTLDESGITNMVETLFRLSEEVNLITVSHIGAVQDAFPSRVEVSMSGAVSSAQVIRS